MESLFGFPSFLSFNSFPNFFILMGISSFLFPLSFLGSNPEAVKRGTRTQFTQGILEVANSPCFVYFYTACLFVCLLIKKINKKKEERKKKTWCGRGGRVSSRFFCAQFSQKKQVSYIRMRLRRATRKKNE